MFGSKTKRIEELELALAESERKHSEFVAWTARYGGEEAWVADRARTAAVREHQEAAHRLQKTKDELDAFQRKYAFVKEHELDYKELSAARAEAERIRANIGEMLGVYLIAEAGLAEDPMNAAQDSVALQAELASVRQQIKDRAVEGKAVRSKAIPESLTAAQRRSLSDNIAKLALRAFNAEVDKVIGAATAANLETSSTKILNSAKALQTTGKLVGVAFYSDYVKLRLRELTIAVNHLKAKQLERELEREHKAELREQAKAERELQAERDRLEKEKSHYLKVLQTVETIGDETEILKLREQIADIERGIADVDYRQANMRAGYVYVISNIGSFGPEMVKIGMTRRLDPMDRVRELGDASVPFTFDVHALFFAEDAVGVEAELHRRFANQRVNQINLRREYFYATPAQVRHALKDIAGNLLEFREEPEAEQYRQSLRVANEQHQSIE